MTVWREYWLPILIMILIVPLVSVLGIASWLRRRPDIVPCPTCGTAHAALALARLDLPGAIAFNSLTTLRALVFLLGGAAVAANWAWLLLHPPPA